MRFFGGAAVAVALLVLAGCGTSDDGPSEAQKAQEKAAQQRQEAQAKREAKKTAVFVECRDVLSPLDKKLTALDSRLSVGLVFEKYSDQVSSAKVTYDAAIRDIKKRGGVSDACLNRVGTPLESALNAYVSAYNTWNDCIEATYCTFNKGTAPVKRAQASWSKASRLTTKADDALSALQP